ncbi:MAG: iron ABC transporter permease [Bacteroidales bacterium]|nr:iron ABC transporter permease [Bacteroidales bacterium]
MSVQSSSYRIWMLLAGLSVLLLLVAAWSLTTGSVDIPVSDILGMLSGSDTQVASWQTILFEFRLPKLLTAIIAGMALSVSGLQMQSLFRNPLAGPYVLGISSGASLGVAILMLGFSFLSDSMVPLTPGSSSIIFAAWLGSGLVLLLVFLTSLRVKNNITLLILGVLIGSAVSSLVTILQYFSHESSLKSFVIWTMGSLGNVSREQLSWLIPVTGVGLVLAFLNLKAMDAWNLGESHAKSLGVNLKRSRIMILLSTSILAGSVTAFCGPIGFIGIAVPHITRISFQTASHRVLFAGNLLIGSLLMIISDLLAQAPGGDIILPINSITALIGIPVVIYLIFVNQGIKVWK